ncbi:LysR substrate-binding domain-containing protein (plasmid) [Phenylobacterium sp. LH3H17]|uniref:LysR substrate-binding domain-containing protein n=1 Tax=Phenylobacterium sp. LH3H17 TaxID=2903901 RepID=UPI0020C9682A|nr:LysR substrate-binding domain-containing protein [Phenylobacterium sp. LH3H17]UTP41705.1 LysR substrate-binding domain-containing protein [Phenylobacterium sp. LH3H17]
MLSLMPPGGAAQPFRGLGDSFPRWTAEKRATLVIGLGCSLNWGFPRTLISAFKAGHPEVDLVLVDQDDDRLTTELDRRRLDLVLGLQGLGQTRWRSQSLWQERLMVLLSEHHPLTMDTEVSAAALRQEQVLVTSDDARSKAMEGAVRHALGGPPALTMPCAVQRDTLLDMVGLGFGVTFTGAHALGAFYPGVCARHLDSKRDLLSYFAFWSPENSKPALRDFLAMANAPGAA